VILQTDSSDSEYSHISPNSTWLVSTRLDTTSSTRSTGSKGSTQRARQARLAT